MPRPPDRSLATWLTGMCTLLPPPTSSRPSTSTLRLMRAADGRRGLRPGKLVPRRSQLAPVTLHVAQLDLLIPPDQVRQRGDPDHQLVVARPQLRQRPGHAVAVLADELPLQPPHPAVAEHVRRRPPQPPHRPQPAEHHPEPRPERDLAPHPQRPQHRRVQPVGHLVPGPKAAVTSWPNAGSRASRATSYSSLYAISLYRYRATASVTAVSPGVRTCSAARTSRTKSAYCRAYPDRKGVV